MSNADAGKKTKIEINKFIPISCSKIANTKRVMETDDRAFG